MQITSPIVQAVLAADFLRSRGIIDADTQQALAADGYLQAAQSVVETGARRMIGERSILIDVPVLGGRFWFPAAPIVSVESVQISVDGGAFAALDAGQWRLEYANEEPQLVMADVPIGARVKIAATGGGGEGPLQMLQAIKLVAGEWMDAGLSLEQFSAPSLSFGARALIDQVRYVRPLVWR